MTCLILAPKILSSTNAIAVKNTRHIRVEKHVKYGYDSSQVLMDSRAVCTMSSLTALLQFMGMTMLYEVIR